MTACRNSVTRWQREAFGVGWQLSRTHLLRERSSFRACKRSGASERRQRSGELCSRLHSHLQLASRKLSRPSVWLLSSSSSLLARNNSQVHCTTVTCSLACECSSRKFRRLDSTEAPQSVGAKIAVTLCVQHSLIGRLNAMSTSACM